MVGELTLLTEGQIWGNDQEKRLKVLKKFGTTSYQSDLSILTGGSHPYSPDFSIGLGMAEDVYTQTEGVVVNGAGDKRVLNSSSGMNVGTNYGAIFIGPEDGGSYYDLENYLPYENYDGIIRPVLRVSPKDFAKIYSRRVSGDKGIDEVLLGEFPQYAFDTVMQKLLTMKYEHGMLPRTGRSYTLPYRGWDNQLQFVAYDEYQWNEKRFICVKVAANNLGLFLINGESYKGNDDVWVEVAPVKWLIDDKTQLLISKIGLLSGLKFKEVKKYMEEYMKKDLFQSAAVDLVQSSKSSVKETNPYGFNMGEVSEEEIIRGAIESGVAVFLHGQSSEGKSARVKEIDPDCVIIYLRNATPESLNGKSVYNASTGEMIDVKPTWLKKLEERCEREPDRYHIVFLDEITNALPSIQGIAFNIVLDREVNGMWKLPENARIVAAGNDMKDSLAANQLAEPLFNRFAHVYIKTTLESWLEWASEHNIHPAIISYITFKNGEVLRSKYDGEKPNADPRKWEMASRMLYTTGQPEMLRALIGEEITRDFCQFCKQRVLTLEDVLRDNYSEEDLFMSSSEIHATIVGLSRAKEADFLKVREFVKRFGPEFCASFELLWAQGKEERLEMVAEARLSEKGDRKK